MMLSILNIIEDTTVDGPGFRTSIYCAGCSHGCEGCHNTQSWSIANGSLMSIEDILKIIVSDPFANVTFSGGDPMLQPEGFLELAKAIKKQTKKNIWCYTGFVFEALVKSPICLELLKYIDVLVDGPFINSQKDTSLLFRGSKNQRLINVKDSLETKKLVLWKPEEM